mgnify:CR=1 FL=1
MTKNNPQTLNARFVGYFIGKVTRQMQPYFLDKYIGGFRLENDNSQGYITM